MLLEIKNVLKQVTEPSGEIITVSHAEHLMLDKGGQMLLTGPSGSGKTTLLHMIAGLLSPSGGEIYFDGTRIDNMPEKERDLWRARNIGYVFQKLNLIEALTAEENILLAGYFAGGNMAELKKRAAMLLERVGLANKKDTLPGKLSIGEQQRIAVVRAVINKPVLLLADEPTGALDSHSSQMLLSAIQSINETLGATILMVTHDAFSASYANRILFLRDGTIFTEIFKGSNSRRTFFEKILDVLTMTGGGVSDVC